jgi:hypothetical protein
VTSCAACRPLPVFPISTPCRAGCLRIRFGQVLAGNSGRRHRTLLNRPNRLSGLTVEGVRERLLGSLNDGWNVPTVYRDVHQDRCRRRVVVPDVVVDHPEMPLPFAGLDVQRDEARTEEVVARAEATPEALCGAVGRHIDQTAPGLPRVAPKTRYRLAAVWGSSASGVSGKCSVRGFETEHVRYRPSTV